MSLEAAARRAARRIGLLAVQSNDRADTPDNCGGFQLIDEKDWQVIAGHTFDLLPDDVLELCAARRAAMHPQNAANGRSHYDSRTGVKGVFLDRNGKFRAHIILCTTDSDTASATSLPWRTLLPRAARLRSVYMESLHGTVFGRRAPASPA